MKVDFLAGALPYAENLGWHVFPLAPGWKLPAIKAAHPKDDPKRGACHGECGGQGHGVWDATAAAECIAEWAKRFPCANIGIACGASSGIIVIDVDPRNAGDRTIRAFAARGYQFPRGPRQRTGNGGWHLLFQHESGAGKPKGKLGQGVDVKSTGGYILGAPSWTRASDDGPGGPYVWEVSPFGTPIPKMPVWMQAILYPPPRPRTEFRSSGPRDIRHLIEFVAKSPDGNRNNSLYWAARRAAEAGSLTPSAERAFLDAALAAGLERDKSEATIQSAAKGAERQ
jgi:hypothetical protein